MAFGKKKHSIIIIFLVFCFLTYTSNSLASNDLNKARVKVAELYNHFFSEQKTEYLNEVLNVYQELIKVYPENEELYWRTAECYYVMANSMERKEALKLLETGKEYALKAVEINPDSAMAHFWVAAMLGESGLRKGILSSLSMAKPMLEELEKCIELDPNFTAAYDIMSQLYFKVPGWPLGIGDRKKALEYRLKTIELDPQNFAYHFNLYEIYQKMNKDEKAEETLHKIIELPADGYVQDYVTEMKSKAREELEKLWD